MKIDFRTLALHSGNSIEGVDFSGFCLAGEPLFGRCFTSCIFDGADLSGCDATGSVFINCDFRGCVLHGATLDGCLFSGCCFDAAEMSQASLIRASLEEVSLRHARLDGAVFEECALSNVDWKGASFVRTLLRGMAFMPDFEDNDLTMTLFVGCDLSGLRLVRVKSLLLNMRRCKAAALFAEDCDLTRLAALNTDCGASVFQRCILQRAGFTGSRLDRCAFSGCDMEGAFLNFCSLRLSVWCHVNLKTAAFTASDLSGAVLEHVNMNRAELSYSRLGGTSFYFADLTRVDAHGADFGAAVLRNVILEQSRHTGADRPAGEHRSHGDETGTDTEEPPASRQTGGELVSRSASRPVSRPVSRLASRLASRPAPTCAGGRRQTPGAGLRPDARRPRLRGRRDFRLRQQGFHTCPRLEKA